MYEFHLIVSGDCTKIVMELYIYHFPFIKPVDHQVRVVWLACAKP
jgi:hypothetical protein